MDPNRVFERAAIRLDYHPALVLSTIGRREERKRKKEKEKKVGMGENSKVNPMHTLYSRPISSGNAPIEFPLRTNFYEWRIR